MATSIPIARALLSDIQPPISTDAIADSLWHYWFDVDKAVTWLRKDWEKKGSPIPSDLRPTPSEQPRRRGAKRPRLDPESSAAPEPPLTALQRLTLSRKAAAPSSSPNPLPAPSPAPSAASAATSSGDTPKPMSKLALLAQKRKEAAAAAAAASSPSPSATASRVAVQSTGASEAATSTEKPLSKLAQKMAAAQASKTTVLPPSSSAPMTASEDVDMATPAPALPAPLAVGADLFLAGHSRDLPPPSAFFRILTTSRPSLPVEEPLGSLHFPFVADQESLERRVRSAFGPDAESPDDIVLKARSGRAGTATMSTAISKT